MTTSPSDPNDDFTTLRKRLARQGEADGEILRAYRQTLSKPNQSLAGRISSFLLSLRRLTTTRRRIEALDPCFLQLLEVNEGRFGHLVELVHAWSSLQQAQGDQLFRAFEAAQNKRDRDVRQDQELRDHARDQKLAQLTRGLQFERSVRQRAFTDFDRALRQLKNRKAERQEPESLDTEPRTKQSPAETSLVEAFYHLLEDRYRGAREEIKQRLNVYKSDLLAAREKVGSGKALIDIGCGRGELLEFARELGIDAVIGVDNNDTQLAQARALGLPVVHEDALSFLRSQRDSSALAVSGIHIVEHIPFASLLVLLSEVARVIDRRGIVIFETPNPRNMIVGSTTFHLDPTHIRPLPPEVLTIALETVGFQKVETRFLHPSDTYAYMVEERNFDPDVAALLYGAQDYAIIASLGEDPCV